ncbi:uncharacterized protein LOC110980656 [Acanthaster planci]|uniref:Uncharacterized protein LOC110980656 n=1 Tax=Acanthaster planci TaxID=133434 RepID=A0A8B7YLB8_ACAPL|nr:uncharacterized protein LOC110980656 [Acanthaster planci]
MKRPVVKALFGSLALVHVLFFQFGIANQYDPHVYPSIGPFIEGWYARLTDTSTPQSFGVLFGRVLPKPTAERKKSIPLTYVAIVCSAGDQAPFVVAEAFPDPDHISVTVDGGMPVTENPDNRSPANFRWAADPYGSFNVTAESTVFNFTIGDKSLAGSFGAPVPWGPVGQGPEGWLSNLPFIPLHWFVYSLSTFGDYTWESRGDGLTIHGNARMHQEKNWGDGFPPSWIWMQGVDSSGSTVFAGTFGVLKFLGYLSITAHLFGYRDYGADVELDFRPDNSISRMTADGCNGVARIEVLSFWYKVIVEARAPPATLQKCLRGPTEYGFQKVLVESFMATVDIAVYKRGYFSYHLMDMKSFEGAAIEFGGEELCEHNPCTAEL